MEMATYDAVEAALLSLNNEPFLIGQLRMQDSVERRNGIVSQSAMPTQTQAHCLSDAGFSCCKRL
ncbi:hypothetical protein ADZ37_24030 [Pannonibacter phragmitetus]|uniref:Uncharacterized protein n=1 Tax=Pannonibacter phragmitetus TaxID=121719 RepID=A0A0L0IST1_9HYPH|nr:hypothetical protein APZ00_24995 [Pannonibacter phragmitetus]KND16249.1 hypothetical protein ADZ37_24030 [Pannonibacter phragmitetus]